MVSILQMEGRLEEGYLVWWSYIWGWKGWKDLGNMQGRWKMLYSLYVVSL